MILDILALFIAYITQESYSSPFKFNFKIGKLKVKHDEFVIFIRLVVILLLVLALILLTIFSMVIIIKFQRKQNQNNNNVGNFYFVDHGNPGVDELSPSVETYVGKAWI